MSGLSCPPWASMSADAAVSLLVVTGKDPSMSEIGARRVARPSARGRAGAWPLLRSSPPAGLTYSMGRRPLLASLRPSIPSARRTGNASASPRHARAPTRASMPHPRRRLASSPGGGLRWGGATHSRAAQVARAASPWSHRRLAPSCPCPDAGIHAPSPPPFGLLPTAPRHSRAPTRESMPLLSGCARPPARHPPLPQRPQLPTMGVEALS